VATGMAFKTAWFSNWRHVSVAISTQNLPIWVSGGDAVPFLRCHSRNSPVSPPTLSCNGGTPAGVVKGGRGVLLPDVGGEPATFGLLRDRRAGSTDHGRRDGSLPSLARGALRASATIYAHLTMGDYVCHLDACNCLFSFHALFNTNAGPHNYLHYHPPYCSLIAAVGAVGADDGRHLAAGRAA